MFHYPYGANGDPSLNLLFTVCNSATQSTNDSPLFNYDPSFFFDRAFPASSSLPSPNENYFMHRSSSVHSLVAHHVRFNPDPASPASNYLDFDLPEPEPMPELVRRVYSTGDIQKMNNMQASAENCTQDSAATTALARPVGRYSSEERKERIERYRSKRNHRNFHKKITKYACRKTLADSRLRVRGRFARNGEIETEQYEAESSETSFDCYSHDTPDNGGRNHDDFESSGGWLKQIQAVLATTEEKGECCYEEDIWTSLDSVFSVNLLS